MNDSSSSDPTGEGGPAGEGGPTGEGVVHLQRAAKEMVAAARSFLDAIENVVDDREALKEVSTMVTGMAATVGDALSDAVRGGRPAPWVDAAWPGDAEPEAASAPEHETASEQDPGAGADPDDATEEWAQPLVDADEPRRPSRVRRIAVE